MKFHPIALVGALLVAAGIATLIYPQVMMPARSRKIQIGENEAIVSTHRVITFPRPFSVILIVCGAAQIFLTTRRFPRR
jgi:hypothetical protein